MKLVRTSVLKIESQPIYSAINAASAAVWNECLKLMGWYQWQRGYPHAHDNFWIGSDCEGWMDKSLSKSQHLHSQSIQDVRKRYFQSWKSFWSLKQSGGIQNPKPPNKQKPLMTTRWLKSAIRFQDNPPFSKQVVLSMGKGREALIISLPSSFDMSKADAIATIDLCYKHGQYKLHFTHNLTIETLEPRDGIMGVDLGEIHPIVCHDGLHTHIFNGRYIRSLYRLRNKVIAGFNAKIDRCKRGSKQWWHLVKRKWKRINRIDNQIKDALDKHTASLAALCEKHNIGELFSAISRVFEILLAMDTKQIRNSISGHLPNYQIGSLTNAKPLESKSNRSVRNTLPKPALLVDIAISPPTETTNANVVLSITETALAQSTSVKSIRGALVSL